MRHTALVVPVFVPVFVLVFVLVLGCAACGFQPTAGALTDAAVGGASDANGPAADARGPAGDASTPPPPPPPTWASDMREDDEPSFYTRLQPGAQVELGVADAAAEDGEVARLVFRGVPARGTHDHVGAAFASELATQRDDFHFGTYRMRARLAACAPGEEVVNGLFTYFNDGTDHDGDGLVDNSEIDLEILCGTPGVLFMSVWTEYSFANEEFRKWTRVIDFARGDIWESPSDHEHGLVFVRNDPSLALPDLLSPSHFVELGFEWRADRVRYFAVVDGAERTLAELTDAARVPQLPAALIFNVWHPAEHWFGGGGPPDYPAHDATMLVDWARYWR
ncbi:MAG TPA: glycoside hydrolase family 16 protein [Kofleriaceae bacterium]|nr:glycoside hydrolase family 16 protein [Kofleriaceae bacterium]